VTSWPPDRQAREAAAARALARAEEYLAREVGRTPEQVRSSIAAGAVRWVMPAGLSPEQPGRPGELVLRRNFTGPDDRVGTVTVLHADPVIRASGVLLHLILRGHGLPCASLEPCLPLDRPAGVAEIIAEPGRLRGWLFRLAHDTGLLVYRVGRYLPGLDVYELSWPD
jgi:hypothetical protein